MIKKVTVYGERCSGTNYLQQLLHTNFDVEIIYGYGGKHFFGFCDLSNSENILYIGIVRNIYDWINSLYREKHHLPTCLTENEDTFLENEFFSVEDNGDEIMCDRNIYTKERYKNIFELRHVKNQYLIHDLPSLVKNYMLITYEDLIQHFKDIMNEICSFNLPIKNNIEFPLNVYYYKDLKNITYRQRHVKNTISKKKILEKTNLQFEQLLYPRLFSQYK